jgi:hypothetical protein
MREIRLSGSEGGGTEFNRFSLPLSTQTADHSAVDKVGAISRTPKIRIMRPHKLFGMAGGGNHQKGRIREGCGHAVEFRGVPAGFMPILSPHSLRRAARCRQCAFRRTTDR